MSKCYLCGTELTADNRSKEHIIINGIGGRLKSSDLLCRKCNSEMGEKADAALAEDLKFFVEMFQIKRERNKNLRGIIMQDEDGHEILVKKGGDELSLHKEKPSIISNPDGSQTIIGTFKDMTSLTNTINSYVSKGKLTRAQGDEIIKNAVPNKERKKLNGSITITSEAFPSIVKTLLSFYIYKTSDTTVVEHLKPYLLNQKKCDELMTLMVFDDFRLAPNFDSVYHTIKIRGNKGEGLVGVIEFFNAFSYAVILEENYDGEEVDLSYCYDLINQKEIEGYNPEVDLSIGSVTKRKLIYHSTPQIARNEAKERIEMVYALKVKIDMDNEIAQILTEEFSKIPQDGIISEALINKIANRIANEVILPRLDVPI